MCMLRGGGQFSSVQVAVDEVGEHGQRIHRLAPGHHVPGVAHHVHAQVAHALEVAGGFSVHLHHTSISVVIGINVLPKSRMWSKRVSDVFKRNVPGLHLLEHLEDS